MKPIQLIIILLLLHSLHLSSQNLIRNGSFDEVRPYSHGDNHSQLRKHFDDNTRFWDTPSGGTPDIILEQYKNDPTYKKKIGEATPRSGESMLGIRVYGCYKNASPHCREYIQTKTTSTILKGKCYEYEYFVLSNNESVRINGVGIGFSEYKMNDLTQTSIVEVEESVILNDIAYNGDNIWVKIAGSFTPKKDYNHIIIGNYYTDEENELIEVENGSIYGYYYIDDVSLYKIDCSTGERETKKTTYLVNDINFAHNQYTIEENAHGKLSDIYKQIVINNYSSITINGYTDDSGTDSYNLNLSQKRAESILEKLTKLGIPRNKMKAIGHGNTNQIDAVNKAKNRRVEIIVE